MLRDIVSITSACLILIAAFFLIRDILELSPKVIEGISLKKDTDIKKMTSELSKQNANTKMGFILIVIAFMCQLYILTTYPSWEQMGPPKKISVVLSIVISIIFFLISIQLSNYIHQNTMNKITKITKEIK